MHCAAQAMKLRVCSATVIKHHLVMGFGILCFGHTRPLQCDAVAAIVASACKNVIQRMNEESTA